MQSDAARLYSVYLYIDKDKPDCEQSLDRRTEYRGPYEWFDLINETIQAFLIVPLYALLNKCVQDREKLKVRIFQSFLTVNVIYVFFSAIIFAYCNHIVSTMVFDHIDEVTVYLRLETIGFIAANIVSFVNVLFVVLREKLVTVSFQFDRTSGGYQTF